MAPEPVPQPGAGGGAFGAGGSGAPPTGFDGVQAPPAAAPTVGAYPPISDPVKPAPGGYPTVAPVSQNLPAGYPGAPAPGPGAAYAPAGMPPGMHGGMQPGMQPGMQGGPGAVMGMPVVGGGAPMGSAQDKIGPFGITAWVLFVAGILFPIAWCVVCFMPLCAKRAARGPKDFMAVRRAAVASSIALCAYLVLVIVLVAMGETRWRRRVCVDRFGNRYYCT